MNKDKDEVQTKWAPDRELGRLLYRVAYEKDWNEYRKLVDIRDTSDTQKHLKASRMHIHIQQRLADSSQFAVKIRDKFVAAIGIAIDKIVPSRFLLTDGTLSMRDNGRWKAHIGTKRERDNGTKCSHAMRNVGQK